MTSRSAAMAAQSDPDRNHGFRRWPAPGRADDIVPMRSWHASDVEPPLSRARRTAEAAWRKVTAEAAR